MPAVDTVHIVEIFEAKLSGKIQGVKYVTEKLVGKRVFCSVKLIAHFLCILM